MGMPPLSVINSDDSSVNAATLKLKVPFGTAIKSGIETELLNPAYKNRLTGASNAAVGSASGWSLSTYEIPFVADATNNWLVSQVAGSMEPDIGQRVYVHTTSALPAPLAIGTFYYVVDNIKQTASGGIKLALTRGGAAIDLTTTGTGTHTMTPVDRPYSTTSTRPTGTRQTFAVNTSSPITGAADFLLTNTNSRLGDTLSCPFTIDSSERGEMLTVEFQYLISAAHFSGTYAVWVNDLTNNELIPVTPANLVYSVSLAGHYSGSFQAASNSTSYELMLVRIYNEGVSSGGGYLDDFRVNNFSVSKKPVIRGPAITDAKSYSPAITGLGTLGTNGAIYWRNGDMLHVKGFAILGTTQTQLAIIPLPTGLRIDSSKVPRLETTAQTCQRVGQWHANAAAQHGSVVVAANTSLVQVYLCGNDSTGEFLKPTNGNVIITTNQHIGYEFTVPILGWSSNSVGSSEEDGRVCSFTGYLAANQALTANVTNLTTTAVKDSHGAHSSGIFTCPLPGDYFVALDVIQSATVASYSIYKNGSAYRKIVTANTSEVLGGSALVPNCVAGDTLSIRADGTCTALGNASLSGNGTHLTIYRLSGPSQIAASETVSCSVYLSANGTAGTATPIPFDSKEYDSHGAFTTGALGRFTAPISGEYRLGGMIRNNAGLGVSMNMILRKNGSTAKAIGYWDNTTAQIAPNVSIKLLAGEYIDIVTSTSTAVVTGAALASTSMTSQLTVTRIGNY